MRSKGAFGRRYQATEITCARLNNLWWLGKTMHRSWNVRFASSLFLSMPSEDIIAELVDELSVAILLQHALLKLRWTLTEVCAIFDKLFLAS